MTPDGLMIHGSAHGPRATMDRLATAVASKGMTVMARIDHAAGAASVGMELRPMEVLIFGNPTVGTPLLQAAATMGIALPLKALVWQDEAKVAWLAYDEPRRLAKRHGADVDANQSGLAAMTEALAAIAGEATGPGPEA